MGKTFLVCGLGWGDCSKGACVDFLCREHNAKLVVRFNGGCQAAHNVVTEDGKHHTFAQFGSGTLIPGVQTHLSRFMMVNPISMMHEEECLQEIGITDAFDRIIVDSRCLITTPFDKEVNRIKEKRNGHGSCGMGIGETRSYHLAYGDEALFAEDLKNIDVMRLKLRLKQLRAMDIAKQFSHPLEDRLEHPGAVTDIIREYIEWSVKVPIGETVSRYVNPAKCVIFEGAQGILLDERDEFLPHNTWSDTTFNNADTLLEEAGFTGEVTRIGCIRSYMTRHGAGPFPTEDKKLSELPEPHNTDSGFQGAFRRGHFDMKSVKHALDICGGVDEIHMSHLDQLPLIYPGVNVEAYVNNTERLLETPITVLGYGPKAEDRRKRDAKGVTARRRRDEVVTGLPRRTEEETIDG